jgi:hypothetical protein
LTGLLEALSLRAHTYAGRSGAVAEAAVAAAAVAEAEAAAAGAPGDALPRRQVAQHNDDEVAQLHNSIPVNHFAPQLYNLHACIFRKNLLLDCFTANAGGGDGAACRCAIR